MRHPFKILYPPSSVHKMEQRTVMEKQISGISRDTISSPAGCVTHM